MNAFITRTLPLLLLVVSPVNATDSVARAVDPLSGEQLWRTFGSLGILVALILGVFWLMRRVGTGPRGGGRQIAFVDALALGQRERLVLVQVGEEQILLGVSPGRVERVHVLEHPVEVDITADHGFSGALRRAVGQGTVPTRGANDAP